MRGRRRPILSVFRSVDLWRRVMLAVLLGPLGAGTTAATAALKTCGVSCPCEEEPSGQQHTASEPQRCEDGGGEADRVGLERDGPCEDACPDNCPECSCCPGMTAGIVAKGGPAVPGHVTSSRALAPPDAPAPGVASSVFRPPRALA